MRRRAFIAGLGSTAAWPVVARAQQPERVRRIGVLMALAENDSEAQPRIETLRQGLRELGWTEGRNIQIDYRWTAGDAGRAKTYAAELVKSKPDVIIANSTLSLMATSRETEKIPIIFIVVGYAVSYGFVTRFERTR